MIHLDTKLHTFNPYSIVSKGSKIAALFIHHSAFFTASLLRQWCWVPGPLLFRSFQVKSLNVASLPTLFLCLKTAWSPIPRQAFTEMGQAEGLRITHSVTYYPAGGLCLGHCLSFLSQCQEKGILQSARIGEWGGKEQCVKIQALYDSLLGLNGLLDQEGLKSYSSYLLGSLPDGPITALHTSLQVYLAAGDVPLRSFILQDLEDKGVEITPCLYRLILELDAFWHSRQNPQQKKYDALHNAVVKTLAQSVNLTIEQARRLEGSVNTVLGELEFLQEGKYLIHFSNHTVSLVKTGEQLAILDPVQGLGITPTHQQREACERLLEYYSRFGSVSLNLLKL